MNDPHNLTEAPPARRFGTWSNLGGGALTFAILFHLILLILAGIWFFKVMGPPAPEPPQVFIGDPRVGPDINAPTRTPSSHASHSPSSDVSWISVKDGDAPASIPAPSDVFGSQTLLTTLDPGGPAGGGGGSLHGRPDGKDNSLIAGDRINDHKPFRFVDPSMSKRCSKADRLQRITGNGGTTACEDAVGKGLLWLKSQQNPDGSWGGNTKVAMTGLALLAYFGHCDTPVSEDFGDTTLKGIRYLVDLGMKNHGRLASNYTANSWPYEHAIATYALAEAATFCKEAKLQIPNLVDITDQAGQFIIDNQHKNGGWAYLYARDGGHTDVSVAGWQIQALKACSHTGIKFRNQRTCINHGLDYVNRCQDKKSGGFGYNSPVPAGNLGYHTLTGVGMLCNQMWGKNTSEVRNGAKYVLANTKFEYNSGNCDLYGHYYESQAMMQMGGSDWKFYNNLFRDQLLNNQDADGSWKVPGGGQHPRAVAAEYYTANHPDAKIYRTCLCTLMLEVYYRFLSTGGGGLDRSGI